MIVVTRAIVATGSYGPKLSTDLDLPQGAEEASGVDGIVEAVREQIGKGADWIKLYADYRWGPGEPSRPTFSQEELNAAVKAAHDAGRPVAAHATTAEGMRRAILAGVETIEHGDEGTAEVFKLMKERGVALCPTVAAGDAIEQYRGWKKGSAPEPKGIMEKHASVKTARAAGVIFAMGGDVGVFPMAKTRVRWNCSCGSAALLRWKFYGRRRAGTPPSSAWPIAAAFARVRSPTWSRSRAIRPRILGSLGKSGS